MVIQYLHIICGEMLFLGSRMENIGVDVGLNVDVVLKANISSCAMR